jgi:hypothetical protein
VRELRRPIAGLDLEPNRLACIELIESPAVCQSLDHEQAEVVRARHPGRVSEQRSSVRDGGSNDRIVGLQPESDLTILLGLSVADRVADDLRDHEDELVYLVWREAAMHVICGKLACKSGCRRGVREPMFHSNEVPPPAWANLPQAPVCHPRR